MKRSLILAFVLFILWIGAAFLPLAALHIGAKGDGPVRDVFRDQPGIILTFLGAWLWLLSAILFGFRDALGLWSAKFRQRLAEKLPGWKKLAGLSEEKAQYYLSFQFNRKMMVVGAVITLLVGAVFVVIGAAISL